MKTIIIKTQEELDSLPAEFTEPTIIQILATEYIHITKEYKQASVEAKDNSSVVAWNSSSVTARDNSSVVAWNSSSVTARDSSSVVACNSSSVEAWGNSYVKAWGNSSVVAWGNSYVVALENSSVVARDNSYVKALSNSSVKALSNSSVLALGNSSVLARENSSVVARENSSVVARENSSVVARDNSSVKRENSLKIDPKKVEYDGHSFRLIIQDEDALLKKLKKKQDKILNDLEKEKEIEETCSSEVKPAVRTIYLRCPTGDAFEKAEVIFESKSHLFVRLSSGLETVFVKNATLYADSESEFWNKMAIGEQNRIDLLSKEIDGHNKNRLSYLEKAEQK